MVTLARARARANTLTYDPARCIGCGLCIQVCPHGVFEEPDARPTPGRAWVALLARPDDCMECGACQLNCPSGAIVVDSGVGCAYALMRAAILGHKQATCDSGCGAEASTPQRRTAEC